MATDNSTQSIVRNEDVASSFNCCSDAFGHISAILNEIEKQAAEYSHIKKLAGAAFYIASDYENLANCWGDEFEGVRSHFVKSEGYLVAHSRKGQDELTPPGKMDVKGSGSITDQVDNVMTVWRNKRKEQAVASSKADEKTLNEPDTLILCDKQRNGEWEGKIGLWFDQASMRFMESKNQRTGLAIEL